MSESEAKAATNPEVLIQRLMDPCAAKSELEWFAAREITTLRQRAEAAESTLVSVRTLLKRGGNENYLLLYSESYARDCKALAESLAALKEPEQCGSSGAASSAGSGGATEAKGGLRASGTSPSQSVHLADAGSSASPTPSAPQDSSSAPPAVAAGGESVKTQPLKEHETCGRESKTSTGSSSESGHSPSPSSPPQSSLASSFTAASDRNWPEDTHHENGNYNCFCATCGHPFVGHKRRVTCKRCAVSHQTESKTYDDEVRAQRDYWEREANYLSKEVVTLRAFIEAGRINYGKTAQTPPTGSDLSQNRTTSQVAPKDTGSTPRPTSGDGGTNAHEHRESGSGETKDHGGHAGSVAQSAQVPIARCNADCTCASSEDCWCGNWPKGPKTEIKRYGIKVSPQIGVISSFAVSVLSPTGGWVLYADHATAVASERERAAALVAALETEQAYKHAGSTSYKRIQDAINTYREPRP